MGLIKTAILAGGGMYAVNKLAKASDNRHNQQSQQYYPPQNPQQNYNYGQGPWGPQGQPRNDYYQQNGQFNGSQQHGQWGPQGPSQYQDRQFNNPPPSYQQQSYTQEKK